MGKAKVASVLIVLFVVGWYAYFYTRECNTQKECIVLCRAQYSASIGGTNEPIQNVSIRVSRVGTTDPIVYITDEYGQVRIPFTVGETYDVTVVYKGAQKCVKLQYNGEATLSISIDIYKQCIDDIKFLKPQSLEKKEEE